MEPYRDGVAGSEADRSVLVVALGGNVLGLDRMTGAVRWTNSLPGGGSHEVFVALRYGVLAVSAWGSKVFRLDYLTGATLWAADTTGSGRATIVVEHDLIVVGKSGYLDGYDHGGRRLWSQSLSGKGTGRLALGFPGNVAQADDPGGQ